MTLDTRALSLVICACALSGTALAGQVFGFTRMKGPNLAFDDVPPLYITSFQHLVAGDFNGDGTVDYAGAFLQYRDVGDFPRFGRIRIAYGPFSQGTLTPATVSLPVVGGNLFIAADDLNGDGDDDLVAFTNIGQDAGYEVGVILTDGVGGFLPRVDHHLNDVVFGGNASARPLLADFDGDGDIDIIVNSYGTAGIFLFRNDGSGAMTSSVVGSVNPAQRPLGWHAAELDGDGRIDLVSTVEISPNTVVYKQQVDGTFLATTTIAAYGWDPTTMDVDGDGDRDLLTGGAWYRNDGAMSFTLANQVQTVTGALKMMAADFDGDGAPEVLNDPNWVFPSIPSPCCTIGWRGVPGSLATEPASNVFAIKLNHFNDAADVDGDGRLDLIEYTQNGGAAVTYFLKGSLRTNALPTLFLAAALPVNTSGAFNIALAGDDADLQSLTWRIVTPPAKGTATIIQTNAQSQTSSPAVLVYDANADATGTDTITVVANDGVEDSAPHTFTLSLNFDTSSDGGSGGGGGSGGPLEVLALWLAWRSRRQGGAPRGRP